MLRKRPPVSRSLLLVGLRQEILTNKVHDKPLMADARFGARRIRVNRSSVRGGLRVMVCWHTLSSDGMVTVDAWGFHADTEHAGHLDPASHH